MSGGKIAQVLDKVVYNTFNSNFMTIEVERRQVLEVAKEEMDRKGAQFNYYPELVNRGELPDIFSFCFTVFWVTAWLSW